VWTLTVGVRGHVSQLVLHYKTQPNALVQYLAATKEGFEHVELTDDFGRSLGIASGLIDFVLLQEIETGLAAQHIAEYELAKAQAALQLKIISDPAIRAVMAQSQPRSPILHGGRG
jgi:hypothetical protein